MSQKMASSVRFLLIVASIVAYSPATAANLSQQRMAPSIHPATDATNPPNWYQVANMPTSRDDMAAATGPDGRIYVMGGYTGQWPLTPDLNVVEAYTPATNTWTTVAPMPTARGWLRAATGKDGRIYAMGGDQQSHPGGMTTAEAYNPRTNTWTILAPMPTARRSMGVVTGNDGRIYVVGGCNQSCNINTVEAYTPSTNTWTTLAPMPYGCGSIGAAVDSSGRIYAIGGFDGGALDLAQTYLPLSNTWTFMANLPYPSDTVNATTGPDGRIYAIAGKNGEVANTRSVVAYTPAHPTQPGTLNVWDTVVSLNIGRYSPATATGPDGHIYVFGGADGSYNGMNVVEAYGPVIHLSTYSGRRGSKVSLNGSNFAGNAKVAVYWAHRGKEVPIARATTDISGSLTSTVQFQVPVKISTGVNRIIIVDNLSHYPITETFIVY